MVQGKARENGKMYRTIERIDSMKHEQVIYNNPPSKSNSYRIVTINGHGSLAKTDALLKYEKDFYLQCGAYRNKKISGFFELCLDCYFSSNRPDLDNALKSTLDCLQTCKAITNDRNCVGIRARKFIDPVRPRLEFTLVEVNGVERRDNTMPSLFDE